MGKSKLVRTAGISTLFSTLLGTGLGWIAYSRLGVDHDRFLPSALPAERRTFNSSSAGELSYYVDDDLIGKPLVLLHSINAAASAYEMRPLFQHYRTMRPVYALDLPGFGFSERADRHYTPDLYVQAITDFLSREVERPADVVALSLSSEFAARAALEQPQLFESLVFISPTGFSAKRGSGSTAIMNELTHKLFSFPLWSQAFYDLLVTRPSIRYFLQKSFAGLVDPELEDYAYETSHQPGALYAPLYFISGGLFTPNILSEVYSKLTLPVLVIYDQDPYSSFDALPDLISNASNWRAEQIVPSRGLPHFEKLDEMVRAIDLYTITI